MTGLYDKYIVTRTDGKVKENAQYFVLDLANDPGAVEVMHAYIDWCWASDREELAEALEALLDT